MKFKIAQSSYIDDKFVKPGDVVTLVPTGEKDGKPAYHLPGPHWEPVDAEAKAYCQKIGHEFTGEVPDAVEAIAASIDKAGGIGGIDHEKLGAAIARGLAAAMPSIVKAVQDAGKKKPADEAA